ncbi:MAG: PAS domain S-box protein, partial [Anaerolineae bacterium]|nr:PAS domain S-box protein [Anaerolineae bacterium]
EGRPADLVVIRDITERKRAEEELREREAQYRGIFESTSDALLIFDFDGTIVEANPAACQMYGYPYEELIGLPGKDIVHPDYHHLFEDFKRQVKASGRFNAQSVDLRKDGSPINVEVHGASFSYMGKPHLLAVARDITERVQARQILERRVEERTRELSTLLEVSHNVASTLELEPLLGLILDQLKAVVDYSGAAVMALEGENLTILAYRGPIPQEEALRLRFPPERARVNHEVIQRREPIIIPDVRGNTSLAHAFGETAGEELETTFSYIRSWMGVPLMVKEQVIGMLTLDHSEPDHYSPRQEELALAFANQAAAAIENARLYERAQELAVVEERSRLARDLHDAVTQTLFSASLIAEVLPRLWERDPDEGWRRLEELRQLTRGALAEMRTLLLELRPSALVD